MTDFVEYLNPKAQNLAKVRWYNEIKMPFLITSVLRDQGEQRLHERME